MKINWKALVAAIYASFVSMILLLAGMSAGQKIELVTDRYYEEELKFQGKIDKMRRAAALSGPLVWEVTGDRLQIRYPSFFADSAVSGTIRMYCPSDSRNDRQFAVGSNRGEQTIALTQVPAGRYRIQIDWKAANETYWHEGVIVIAPQTH
ncbi:FixH family protein [Dyadobacter sp. 676]|uniref:FixH family protein n=1 Tax=Dyadobacter sp. 676 TaxID=3088362 RepID=A0AAU8FN38_9BACT